MVTSQQISDAADRFRGLSPEEQEAVRSQLANSAERALFNTLISRTGAQTKLLSFNRADPILANRVIAIATGGPVPQTRAEQERRAGPTPGQQERIERITARSQGREALGTARDTRAAEALAARQRIVSDQAVETGAISTTEGVETRVSPGFAERLQELTRPRTTPREPLQQGFNPFLPGFGLGGEGFLGDLGIGETPTEETAAGGLAAGTAAGGGGFIQQLIDFETREITPRAQELSRREEALSSLQAEQETLPDVLKPLGELIILGESFTRAETVEKPLTGQGTQSLAFGFGTALGFRTLAGVSTRVPSVLRLISSPTGRRLRKAADIGIGATFVGTEAIGIARAEDKKARAAEIPLRLTGFLAGAQAERALFRTPALARRVRDPFAEISRETEIQGLTPREQAEIRKQIATAQRAGRQDVPGVQLVSLEQLRLTPRQRTVLEREKPILFGTAATPSVGPRDIDLQARTLRSFSILKREFPGADVKPPGTLEAFPFLRPLRRTREGVPVISPAEQAERKIAGQISFRLGQAPRRRKDIPGSRTLTRQLEDALGPRRSLFGERRGQVLRRQPNILEPISRPQPRRARPRRPSTLSSELTRPPSRPVSLLPRRPSGPSRPTGRPETSLIVPSRQPPTRLPPSRAPTTLLPPTRVPTTILPPSKPPTTLFPPSRPPTRLPPSRPPTSLLPPSLAPPRLPPAPPLFDIGGGSRARRKRRKDKPRSKFLSSIGVIFGVVSPRQALRGTDRTLVTGFEQRARTQPRRRRRRKSAKR